MVCCAKDYAELSRVVFTSSSVNVDAHADEMTWKSERGALFVLGRVEAFEGDKAIVPVGASECLGVGGDAAARPGCGIVVRREDAILGQLDP